jgi:5'-nucleotidase
VSRINKISINLFIIIFVFNIQTLSIFRTLLKQSSTMKRRSFLQKSAFGTLLFSTAQFPLSALDKPEIVKLTILHTNDVHSRIEAFPEDGGRYAGLGGAAKRATLIKKIRKEEENVLLLDAGDVFQGTPYFNFFGGELEFKLMTEMGYDACTIGNHDFDGGMEGLHKQFTTHANFPLLNCNYNLSNTIMNGQVQPHMVIKKAGLKIGILGVGLELDGLVPANLYGETQYLDPISNVNKTALHLRKELKCDYVICLSHLGYQYGEADKVSDLILAKNSKNVDLIIGGHTHTLMETADIVKNLDDEEVTINQVGWAGIALGRLDVFFERNKKNKCITCDNGIIH